MRRLDRTVELHVLPQAELVGDMIEIAQILGLAGEALLPVPFVEQFPREGIAVGIALRIEAAAGIAVPVPGAAEVGRRVEHGGIDAEIDQALDLVDAGHTGADHDHLVMGLAISHSLLRNLSAAASARLAGLQSLLQGRSTGGDRMTGTRECAAVVATLRLRAM